MAKIITSYPVEITIDEDVFHVVVSDLDSTQREEMDKRAVALEAVTADIRKAASLDEDIATNKELIGCVGLIEKAKLLWENKELKKEAEILQKSIETANPDKMFTDSLMRRLELTISGEDKVKLMATIKSKTINPQSIIAAIGEQIAEIKKKK